jgi:hypothetical protein
LAEMFDFGKVDGQWVVTMTELRDKIEKVQLDLRQRLRHRTRRARQTQGAQRP